MILRRLKVGLGLSAALGLAGCSVTGPAPVYDLSNGNHASKASSNSNKTSSALSQHKVKPGETLFSIAWRYSLDHKQLAKLNAIKGNRIYPGQLLNLKASPKQTFDANRLVAAINKDFLNKKERSSAKAKPSVYRSASLDKSQKRLARTSKPKVVSRKKTTRKHIPATTNPVKNWIWPVNGKVINRFSKNSINNKGVDIAAKKGSPVRATAKGRVVYSGNGLRGYGHLVIIKHNDKFLSAYAHNDKIHVKENEIVKAGQKIADLGSSGSDREKLHFEIRYKGKPVDPLNYLPKSGLL